MSDDPVTYRIPAKLIVEAAQAAIQFLTKDDYLYDLACCGFEWNVYQIRSPAGRIALRIRTDPVTGQHHVVIGVLWPGEPSREKLCEMIAANTISTESW